MSKTEVEGILGSPSTTASINFQGDSNYYITSVTQSLALSFKAKEVSREVIAVRFDKGDQVTSFAQYGLEDGRIININSRETPIVGNELSILQDIFKGILGSKPGLLNLKGALSGPMFPCRAKFAAWNPLIIKGLSQAWNRLCARSSLREAMDRDC